MWLARLPTYPTWPESESVSLRSTNTFHCLVSWGRRSLGKIRKSVPGPPFTLGMMSAKPTATLPGPVVASKTLRPSKLNGGFWVSLRFFPVPSMYCTMPNPPRSTHLSEGVQAKPTRGSKPP